MWTVALSLAFGAPVEDEALEDLPWRVENAEGWMWADRRATGLARAASWTAGIGGAAALAGSGMAALGSETGDDNLVVAGALLGTLGVITAVSAPPAALAGSLRAQRSLRQRGVYVSPSAAVIGWSLYGTGLFAIPALIGIGVTGDQGGLAVLGTAWYASIVVLPLGQIDVNRRGREAAGLEPVVAQRRTLPVLTVVPSRNGITLAGAF